MNEKYFGDCTNPVDLGTRYSEIKRVFGLDSMPNNLFKKEVEDEFRAKMMSFTPEPQKAAEASLRASYDDIQAWLISQNIPAEKIGKWFWVPDKPVSGRKDEMKRLGFRYSESKRLWYWRSDKDKSSNPNPLPLDVIRQKYGSQSVGISG